MTDRFFEMLRFRPNVRDHRRVATAADAVLEQMREFRAAKVRLIAFRARQVEYGLFEKRQGFVDERRLTFRYSFGLDTREENFDRANS